MTLHEKYQDAQEKCENGVIDTYRQFNEGRLKRREMKLLLATYTNELGFIRQQLKKIEDAE